MAKKKKPIKAPESKHPPTQVLSSAGGIVSEEKMGKL